MTPESNCMATPRTIRVFIASPGDLGVERRAFKDVIDDLNKGFGDGAGVEFVALGWEDALATTGHRSQAVIDLDVDRCDAFVLTMYTRWGQDARMPRHTRHTPKRNFIGRSNVGKPLGFPKSLCSSST